MTSLVDLDNDVVGLLNTLTVVVSDLILSFTDKTPSFQKKNSRSLLRRIELFVVLLDSVRDSGEWWSNFPSTLVLCFKELYLLVYRSKILLDYCTQSSKLWLLLQNPSISGHFHDLNQEISTLLHVFPMNELNYLITDDVREQINLLDEHDESLRLKFFNLLNEIGNGNIPNLDEFCQFFIGKLGIFDARSCRVEIQFLKCYGKAILDAVTTALKQHWAAVGFWLNDVAEWGQLEIWSLIRLFVHLKTAGKYS